MAFLQVNPGEPACCLTRNKQIRLTAFLQVNPGELACCLTRNKHTRLTAFLQVNPGEPAADQSKIHIIHCLHFHRHYEITYLLSVSSIFTVQCIRCSVDSDFNALVLINIVTLHQARLVPGWATILGWVSDLGAEPGTQVDSASAIPP